MDISHLLNGMILQAMLRRHEGVFAPKNCDPIMNYRKLSKGSGVLKQQTAAVGARHNAKYLRVVGGESGELVSQVSRKTDKLRTAQKLPSRRQGFDSMAHNTANSRRRWLSETELAATGNQMDGGMLTGDVGCMTDDDDV